MLKISNGSKNRCRAKFDYKGIGKIINRAYELLEKEDVEVIISECIYDSGAYSSSKKPCISSYQIHVVAILRIAQIKNVIL